MEYHHLEVNPDELQRPNAACGIETLARQYHILRIVGCNDLMLLAALKRDYSGI